MEKEVKARGRKKVSKLNAKATDLSLRVINLHSYDLKEIDTIDFRLKDGRIVQAGFHATPVEAPLSSDDKVYIRLVETKPYYNRYQLMFSSSLFTTAEADLAIFTSQEKLSDGNHNPHYTYEF